MNCVRELEGTLFKMWAGRKYLRRLASQLLVVSKLRILSREINLRKGYLSAADDGQNRDKSEERIQRNGPASHAVDGLRGV